MNYVNAHRSLSRAFGYRPGGVLRTVLVTLSLLVSERTWGAPLMIGSVGKDATKEIKKFLPLTAYLAGRLRADGVDEVKVVVVPNLERMAELVRSAKVDLYIDSPFPAMYLQQFAQSKFLARRWKEGVAEYHAIIFVRKDSPIDQLADLKGKTIGFEAPFSSSGYFMPKIDLTQQGLSLVESKTAVANRIAYQFTEGDRNTLAWVVRERVAAGAMDLHKFNSLTRNDTANFRVLDKSVAIPRHIVSHRADLGASLAIKIKAALLAMDQSAEGRKALEDFERTAKFDELPAAAMLPVLRGWKSVEAEFFGK